MTRRGALSFFALALVGLGPATAQEGEAPELGWTAEAPAVDPETPDEELSELDRLSRSFSGTVFGSEVYDAQSDNPLEPVSVTLRALDKITATYTDLEVPIGETASFGSLTLLPRTCSTRPPEEFPETSVFLEVYAPKDERLGRDRQRAPENRATPPAPERRSTIRLPGESDPDAAPTPDGRNLFKGWMFASTPSLNALEHPVYDVWVMSCRMVDPEA